MVIRSHPIQVTDILNMSGARERMSLGLQLYGLVTPAGALDRGERPASRL